MYFRQRKLFGGMRMAQLNRLKEAVNRALKVNLRDMAIN
jgi:hypothetical protein